MATCIWACLWACMWACMCTQWLVVTCCDPTIEIGGNRSRPTKAHSLVGRNHPWGAQTGLPWQSQKKNARNLRKQKIIQVCYFWTPVFFHQPATVLSSNSVLLCRKSFARPSEKQCHGSCVHQPSPSGLHISSRRRLV